MTILLTNVLLKGASGILVAIIIIMNHASTEGGFVVINTILLALLIPFITVAHEFGCPSFEHTYLYKMESWRLATRVANSMSRGTMRKRTKQNLVYEIARQTRAWPDTVYFNEHHGHNFDECYPGGVPCN